MKGHTQLIDMRRQGYAPSLVMIETDADFYCPTGDWPAHTPTRAQLRVDPSDNLGALDLRCLVGLKVMVSGSDEVRVRAVAAAAERAKAGRVIGVSYGLTDAGKTQVAHMTDTAGVLIDG